MRLGVEVNNLPVVELCRGQAFFGLHCYVQDAGGRFGGHDGWQELVLWRDGWNWSERYDNAWWVF